MAHKMMNERAKDLGRWNRCTECGATFHSEHWWLGGYKSKSEPPCKPWFVDKDWRDNAQVVDSWF